MAALDFPASPVDGQTYSNWTYSSSKGAWQAKPLTPGQAQPSATAPTSPSNGDQWYNTNDGNLYIYYNDGDTSQWVQVKSDATLSSTLGSRVTTLETYPSGLVPVTPTSITVGSGSGSVSGNGLVTLSAANAVSLDGVFTSAYRDYFIQYNFLAVADSGVSIRLRASGTTAAGASTYGMGRIYQVNASIGGQNNGWADAWGLIPDTRKKHYGTINLYRPQVANYTNIQQHGIVISAETDATSMNQQFGFGIHNQTTSYDGLYFYNAASSNMTGTIQVYGYRN